MFYKVLLALIVYLLIAPRLQSPRIHFYTECSIYFPHVPPLPHPPATICSIRCHRLHPGKNTISSCKMQVLNPNQFIANQSGNKLKTSSQVADQVVDRNRELTSFKYATSRPSHRELGNQDWMLTGWSSSVLLLAFITTDIDPYNQQMTYLN